MFDRKSKSVKYKKLDVSVGVLEAEKKGDPKNAGISHLIYENKGRGKTTCGKSHLLIENKQVIRFCLNVDENKGG